MEPGALSGPCHVWACSSVVVGRSGSNLSVRQGRPPQQGCCVFLWGALCGYCDGFQEELMENVRSQPHPPSHRFSGKGVTMSTMRSRNSNSERPSSCPRSHSSGWLPRAHSLPDSCGRAHLPGLSAAEPASCYPTAALRAHLRVLGTVKIPRPHP